MIIPLIRDVLLFVSSFRIRVTSPSLWRDRPIQYRSLVTGKIFTSVYDLCIDFSINSPVIGLTIWEL